MAFPIVPFLVGMAAGSLATYLAKDKAARDAVKKGADTVTDKVSAGVHTVAGMVPGRKTAPEVHEASAAEEASTPPPEVVPGHVTEEKPATH
jgi:hypothetical protein